MSISRRNFISSSAGVAAARIVLSSTLPRPLLAAQEAMRACTAEPQPIPHTHDTGLGTTIHFFFPGPVDSKDPDTGHDPSLIFDFSGVIGQADLCLTGTGTDLITGDSAPYDFHTDMRFMTGRFVGTDGEQHKGAFAFI
jgi:hypothetical protein